MLMVANINLDKQIILTEEKNLFGIDKLNTKDQNTCGYSCRLLQNSNCQ